jgi:phage gp16-like protein
MNTTNSNKSSSKDLTFDDVLRAKKMLDKVPKPKVEKIEVGELALEVLKKITEDVKEFRKRKNQLEMPILAHLYGMPVKINPYLPRNAIKIGDIIFLLKD